ncbi:hypothetical protein K0T92_24185 [Paenibacillus oenotherae]|uniref:PhiEco32-like amidoligase-type 2 protein n=1 Tax=Paenibacillus oenotherae TaxID=1435645 RepID=A0ABS7DCZ9_9BACL|nr:hypothetical protein [Paenibacillus oenotherae]MBW7477814.1 hypothetical protein [Paenibacillus oenotherae]
MAGKLWFWDGEGRENGLTPRAWIDGNPEKQDCVIVCGSSPLPEHWRSGGMEPLVLNGGAAAFVMTPGREMDRRLRRAGIVISDNDRAGRRFSVSIFHPRTLEIRRIVDTELQVPFAASSPEHAQRQLKEHDPLFRRLGRLAMKALYAASLDFGVVVVTVADHGSCAVESIRLPDSGMLQDGIWARAIKEYVAVSGIQAAEDRVLAQGRIRIGADPEFLLLSSSGKVVPAAKYLAGGYGTGCDAVVVGGRILYPVAELRPEPAAMPHELANNIRRLLVQASAHITDRSVRWAAGGMPAAGFALGGHIHLSGVPLTGRLLRQLDSYAALLLALVETPAEHARRPRFGTLGDCRLQPHGGFEYRTLPSWLVSPLAAKAAFALALLCARESDVLIYRPMEDERMVEAYYSADLETLRECVEPLAASMKRTASYDELGRWIDPLLDAVRRRESWDTAADLRMKWRIPLGS